METPLGAIA